MSTTPDTKSVGTKDKTVSWYHQGLPEISPATRELLEKYSGIESERVVQHVEEIRSTGWDIYPYPCIGSYRFLDLGIMTSPHYAYVLNRLRHQDQKLLDIGCCFGQDIRKLAFDGVSSENLVGSDLRDEFTELGYKLFCDKGRMKARFLNGDFFADNEHHPLKSLEGNIDIIHASSFFHLFDWQTQVEVGKRVVKLLRPKEGSMVFGRQAGAEPAGLLENSRGGNRYRHNAESWDKMWQEIGKLTGSKWKTEVLSEDPPSIVPADMPGQRGGRWLKFACWRQE